MSVTSLLSEIKRQIGPFRPTYLTSFEEEKTTVIVVAGGDFLQTFILNDINDLITKSGYYKSNLIKVDSPVIKIESSKCKTYCLHQDERVSVFVSYKKLKRVKDISNCLDLIALNKGVSFLLKTVDGNLTVKVLNDNQSSTQIQCEYKCGQVHNNEHCFLSVLKVKQNNLTSLKLLLGTDFKNTKGSHHIMISIGITIFLIKSLNDEDYEVQTVRTCSSIVVKFWYSSDINALNIFLSSGVLEIIYICSISKLATHKRFYFIENIQFIDFVDNTLIIGSTFDVASIKIVNDHGELKCMRKSSKCSGVTAICFIRNSKLVLFVTENGLFYTLIFDTSSNETSNFMEATSKYLKRAKYVQNHLCTSIKKLKDIEFCKENYNKQADLRRTLLDGKIIIECTDGTVQYTTIFPKNTTELKILKKSVEITNVENIYAILELRILQNGLENSYIDLKKLFVIVDEIFSTDLTTQILRKYIIPFENLSKLLFHSNGFDQPFVFQKLHVSLSYVLDNNNDMLLIENPCKISLLDLGMMVNIINPLDHNNLCFAKIHKSLTEKIDLMPQFNSWKYIDLKQSCVKMEVHDTHTYRFSYILKYTDNLDMAARLLTKFKTCVNDSQKKIILNVLGNHICLHFNLLKQEITIEAKNMEALTISKKYICCTIDTIDAKTNYLTLQMNKKSDDMLNVSQ